MNTSKTHSLSVRTMLLRFFATVLCVGQAAVLAGCQEQEKAGGSPPLPEVEVVDVVRKDIPIHVEWVGTMDGCPDYRRPDVDTPKTFRFEETEAKNLANTAWWEQFQDPVLNNAELNYTQVQGTLFQALVNLYKAMGGGWVVEADRMTGYTPVAEGWKPPVLPFP